MSNQDLPPQRPLVAPSRVRSGDDASARPGETGDAGRGTGQEVAGHTRSEAEEAALHARQEVAHVADATRSEVRDVVDEARDALREQADRQSHVAAEAIGRVRDDLRAMAGGDRPRETTADYLDRAARSLDEMARRLDDEGVEGALTGIRRFARRSPGSFLLTSAGAGFAVGRLLRNADHPQQVDEQHGSSEQARTGRSSSDDEIDLRDKGPVAPGPQVERPLLSEEARR